MRAWWMTVVVLMSACTPEGETPEFTTDTRIDMAPEASETESTGTVMCVSPTSKVYVAWADDRDGASAVWLNRSLDGGNSWLASPVKVNHGEGRAEAPALTCTEQGVFVVWEDDRDGELENHQIYFNYSLNDGNSFQDEDSLLETDVEGLTMSLGPQIVAVGSDLYVAWFDSLNGAYDIYVASSGDNGQNWREPVRVDTDAVGEAHSAWPQIAATEFGDVYVAWEDARNGSTDVYFSRSDNAGTSFLDNVRLDVGDAPGEGYSFNPRMGVDGDNIYVVWHDDRNGDGRDVYLNYSANGGRDWLVEDQRVDGEAEGFYNSLYADLAVVGPVAHVAYHDDRNTGYDIYYRKVVSGVPAAEETRIESDGPGFSNSINARVAYGSGTVVVAWEDSRAEAASGAELGFNDLYYNLSADGGATWGEEDLRIDSMAPGESYKIEVNLQVVNGEVFSAWTDGRNGTADVYFQHHLLGEGGSFLDPEQAQTAETAQ
ncbi:MAG: hypothetical protein ACI8PZ_001574 [Myxococcota bacterium]|jgi:hypothetical protein